MILRELPKTTAQKLGFFHFARAGCAASPSGVPDLPVGMPRQAIVNMRIKEQFVYPAVVRCSRVFV
jgi:hypothetical protein